MKSAKLMDKKRAATPASGCASPLKPVVLLAPIMHSKICSPHCDRSRCDSSTHEQRGHIVMTAS